MASASSDRSRRVFRRYRALEVAEELMNDSDSGEENLYSGEDNDFDEEENDSSHHPLLHGILSQTEPDVDFEPMRTRE